MTKPSQAQIDAALDQLSRTYLRHPGVSLIDYGLSLETATAHSGLERTKASPPGLRIHLRGNVHESDFPKEVDGIPVSLVRADYRLEPEPNRKDET
jgi:hypothetical protein